VLQLIEVVAMCNYRLCNCIYVWP